MRIIRNVVFLGAVSAAALTLSACESMKSAGDKITSINVPFYGDDEETNEVAAASRVMATNECPQVAIVEDLKNLAQFETPSQPSPGTKISSVALNSLESACSATDKTVAIDMSLTFDGELGPKASEWKTQSRSFAYPYFIAVTTPTGEILSKEVFAATMRYEAGEAAISQQEKIRQVIPLRPETAISGYEVLVGFQLTDDELNYARMMATNPMAYQDPAPVAAEKPKPKKKKVVKKEEPKVEAAPATPVEATPVAAEPAPATAPAPEAAAAPVPEATPAPVAAPVTAPAPQPIPTTTDGSMNSAPTSSEVKADSPQPVAETVTPAQAVPAPTDPAAQDPNANPAATPAPATAPAPAFDPYAPPPTQVIRVKPDGSVEKQ